MTTRTMTMARLAAELGVSISTISNAYNRPEKLSSELRARVLATAGDLGYAGPNPLARALRRQKTGGIGVIFADELSFAFSDAAASGFLSGVSEILTTNDHHLVLVPAGTPDRRRRAPLDKIAVDGVILHSLPVDDPTLLLVQRRGTPAVLVDQPGPTRGIGWVGLDEQVGAHGVGAHLRSLGHTRVGCITSRLGTAPFNGNASERRWKHSRYDIPRQRITGFQTGLGHAVLVEERWLISEADGANAAAALLRRDPSLTAIACIADTYALGVLDWARNHHIQVPRQLSVVGYDGIPQAPSSGLSTVSQPFHQKGNVAAEMLLATIAGEQPPQRRKLPTVFTSRSTTGAAPASSMY